MWPKAMHYLFIYPHEQLSPMHLVHYVKFSEVQRVIFGDNLNACFCKGMLKRKSFPYLHIYIYLSINAIDAYVYIFCFYQTSPSHLCSAVNPIPRKTPSTTPPQELVLSNSIFYGSLFLFFPKEKQPNIKFTIKTVYTNILRGNFVHKCALYPHTGIFHFPRFFHGNCVYKQALNPRRFPTLLYW